MATAFSGAGSRTSDVAKLPLDYWSADATTFDMLDAIGNIIVSESLALVRVDRRAGTVAVATRGANADVQLASPVRAALVPDRGAVRVDGQACWIGAGPGEHRATMVVRLTTCEEQEFFLVTQLAETLGARGRAERLMPHIAQLLGLHLDERARWRRLAEERDAAAQALDHDDCGVIAIRTDHSIVLANAAARMALSAEAGLRLRRGAVHPTSHGDAVRFSEAVNRVIDPPASREAGPPRALAMLLAGTRNERPAIVVIAPAERAGDSTGTGAAAVLYLIQPSLGPQRGLNALCRLHGLSRVETRVMVQLANGLTIAEAAAELRIKIDTARSYLKQIFGKLGVHRQTDLVGLMSRYQRALRGDFEFEAA